MGCDRSSNERNILMTRRATKAFAFALMASLYAATGLAAGGPAAGGCRPTFIYGIPHPLGGNWVAELPTVDEVRRTVESGADVADTAARQEATFYALNDLIELFSDVSPSEPGDCIIALMPPAAAAHWREYRAIWTSHRGPSTTLERYHLSVEFQQGVLAKYFSRASAEAYPATVAAKRQRSVPDEGWRFPADEQGQRRALDSIRAWEVAKKKVEAQATAQRAEARAREAEDGEVRRVALADGERGRGHTDMMFFGVPLGAVLSLPDCQAVGHQEQRLFGKVLESEQTCFENVGDEQRAIHWGDGKLADWAQFNIHTTVKTDVLVAVTVVIPSWPRPPRGTVNPGFVDAIVDGAMQTGYENELKNGPARVAKAQKQLRAKYKKPSKSSRISFERGDVITHQTDELEWNLPGLHVKYSPDVYEDTLTVELDSVSKARVQREQKEEAAEPTP
jgi:hypothetical protein